MKLACLILAIGSLHAQSPGQPSYERANTLFVARQFDKALAAVDEALRLDARLVPALTLKAKMALAAQRYDVARQCLEDALRVEPRSPYAQFLYGMEAYLNNEIPEALERFRKTRSLAPNDPRAALYLGLATESAGETEPALALYREAVRLEKESGRQEADTFLPGARLLLLLGRLDDCEIWLRQAVKLAPRMRDARFELARLLLKKKRAPEAATEGEAALALSGGVVADSAIHYLLIRAWREAGHPDRAARHAAVMRAHEDVAR